MDTFTVTNDARGNIRVHRPGCKDIAKQATGGGASWTVDTADLRGIVVDLYPADCFEDMAEDGSNWRDFAGDVTVMPCAGALPDEA